MSEGFEQTLQTKNEVFNGVFIFILLKFKSGKNAKLLLSFLKSLQTKVISFLFLSFFKIIRAGIRFLQFRFPVGKKLIIMFSS